MLLVITLEPICPRISPHTPATRIELHMHDGPDGPCPPAVYRGRVSCQVMFNPKHSPMAESSIPTNPAIGAEHQTQSSPPLKTCMRLTCLIKPRLPRKTRSLRRPMAGRQTSGDSSFPQPSSYLRKIGVNGETRRECTRLARHDPNGRCVTQGFETPQPADRSIPRRQCTPGATPTCLPKH